MKFSVDKDVQKLAVEFASKPGWSVKPRGAHGHAKIVAPNGHAVPVSKTPSDNRTFLNLRGQLRRLERECMGAQS
jgi:hypothetical protein